MAEFGPSEFGPATFGGDPSTAGLILDVDAEVTSMARRLLARRTTDGTAFKVIEFTLGQGGLDPFDYKTAVPVNPDAQALELPITLSAIALPGTLATTSTDPVVLTSNDLTEYLEIGYLVEVVTASGTETLTVASVTSTQFTASIGATWTDPIATGSIVTHATGAKNVTEYEHPNPSSGCTYCVVVSAEANEALSEIGVWARILWSPYTSEIGTVFLAAVAHFPLVCKNSSMSYAFRVNVQF